MSQDYEVPQNTDTLSAGRGKIANSLDALRSGFSGSSAPTTPVEGQEWYDTVHKLVQRYDGTSWKPVGAMAKGMVSLNSGSGAPTLQNGLNITSVVRDSAGKYTITIPATLPNTDANGFDYAFNCIVTETTANTIRLWKIISKTATTVQIGIFNAGGSLADGSEGIDFSFELI